MASGVYGDDCMRFFQSFLTNPCQSADLAKINYSIAHEETKGSSIAVDEMDPIIDVMNEKLEVGTSFVIKSRKCDVTGKLFYVLLNKSDFDYTRKSTPYSKREKRLHYKILNEILNSDEGYLTSMTVVDLGSSLTPAMNSTEVQKVLCKLVSDDWFVNKGGRVYISARNALELESGNSKKTEKLKCTLCKKSLYYGLQCGECNEPAHSHCLNRYFRMGDRTRKCPGCREPWSTELPEVESD